MQQIIWQLYDNNYKDCLLMARGVPKNVGELIVCEEDI
jgi:hypothetical protein